MSVEEHLRIFGAKQGLTGAALNDAVTRWLTPRASFGRGIWAGEIPAAVINAAFDQAQILAADRHEDPPRANARTWSGHNEISCDDCRAPFAPADPWWVEIEGKWIHLCVRRCSMCKRPVWLAAKGCVCDLKPKRTWTDKQRQASDATRERQRTARQEARDERLREEERRLSRIVGDPFARYPMDRWRRSWGDKARRCSADGLANRLYPTPQRCAGVARKGSLYCQRHRHFEPTLEEVLGPDPQDFVRPRDPGLERRLREPISWRFSLDPGALDNIGSSLHGGGVPSEVLEQLPSDLGPLELAGYGRPWQKGLAWIQLTDDQAEKAAREFARTTSGPRLGTFDRMRIRPGQEERVGPRRRRPRADVVPEISVAVDHWRAAP